MPAEVCIGTFPTTHAALSAERIATQAGVHVRMIPVPRGISADCNMGMEAPVAEMEQLRSLLAIAGVECDLVSWTKR